MGATEAEGVGGIAQRRELLDAIVCAELEAVTAKRLADAVVEAKPVINPVVVETVPKISVHVAAIELDTGKVGGRRCVGNTELLGVVGPVERRIGEVRAVGAVEAEIEMVEQGGADDPVPPCTRKVRVEILLPR